LQRFGAASPASLPAAQSGKLTHESTGPAIPKRTPSARRTPVGSGDEFLTPPLVFRGKLLVQNLNARATGVAQVGLLDADGQAFPGFTADDCDEIRGNATAQTVSWAGNSDRAALAGAAALRHARRRALRV